MFYLRALLIVTAVCASASSGAAADGRLPGPVDAEVVRVIDGDTVLVDATPWPNHQVRTYVRLRGIDAHELRSRCSTFRLSAYRAKDVLEALLTENVSISLLDISGDKYFGRVVAEVALKDGRRPADELLRTGLAFPYEGKKKHRIPCPG